MARKKRQKNLVLLFLLLFFLGAATLFALLWWKNRTAELHRFTAFGIPMPSGFTIHGIDVSHYQQQIDWQEVRAMKPGGIQLHFAFMKATEGVQLKDKTFRRNWEKTREVGIVRGAYHFFIASESGKVQANHFIAQVQLKPGDLPPVLDVEKSFRVPKAKLIKGVKEWLQKVEAHYGVRPLIYTNVRFYERYLRGHFDDYPLWVAHYLQPQAPRISRSWHFWQHSESGRVNGIPSQVDFNVFQGDTLAFKSILITNGSSSSTASR